MLDSSPATVTITVTPPPRTTTPTTTPSSTDNVGVDRYELARNDALVQVLPSSAASATVAAARQRHLRALGALDPAGNRNERPTVTVELRGRPAVRASVPAWSWRLLAWRAAPSASRGPRPAAPLDIPDWYWTSAAWRLNPFRIVS